MPIIINYPISPLSISREAGAMSQFTVTEVSQFCIAISKTWPSCWIKPSEDPISLPIYVSTVPMLFRALLHQWPSAGMVHTCMTYVFIDPTCQDLLTGFWPSFQWHWGGCMACSVDYKQYCIYFQFPQQERVAQMCKLAHPGQQM